MYKGLRYVEKGIELSFDHAEGGIMVKGEKSEGFEIAGEDKEFLEAAVEIQGDKILVYSEKVPEPRTVRYAWTNYGPVTIFNKAGLPLGTFRTKREE